MLSRDHIALSRRRRQRGSALIELSLTLLAFLLLTLGGMEAGWGIYAYNFCGYAAQDAARQASVHGSQSTTGIWTSSDVTSFVQSEAVGLTPSQLSVTTNWSPNNAPGSTVTVTVGYTIYPLAGLALKQSLYVASTAQYYIDR